MATVTLIVKHLTTLHLTIKMTTKFHLTVTAMATVTVMAMATATATVTVKKMVTSCLGITLTTASTVHNTPKATDTVARTTSSGKNLGPTPGLGDLQRRSSKSYGRKHQDASPIRDHRRGEPQSAYHRSRSRDRSRSYHFRDRDKHVHQRVSRTSPQGKRDSFLASFSSYEEYLDYFNKSGTSNQDSYCTPLDSYFFSVTLLQ